MILLSKSFIRISNEWLTNADQGNIFERIGTEGFAIYCVLLKIRGTQDKFQVNLKQIQQLLSKNYKSRPLIKYSTTKKNKINVIKDIRTIKKYIKALTREKLIETDCNVYNITVNDFMTVEILEENYPKGFTAIASDLILDKLHKVGHVGFSLLYILTNLFNKDYGGEYSQGFANPSEEYLSKIIKRDINTIRAYLYLLQDKKLLKIEPQSKILLCYNKDGDPVYQYLPNHYIVKNKLSENKYYINFKE